MTTSDNDDEDDPRSINEITKDVAAVFDVLMEGNEYDIFVISEDPSSPSGKPMPPTYRKVPYAQLGTTIAALVRNHKGIIAEITRSP